MKNFQKTILYFFNFMLLSVPLYFRFINEELFEFNKMILVYALTTFIVFLWLVRMIQEQRFIFKKTPLDISIALFLLSQLVSTVFSIHPRTSWLGYYSRFNGGLLSTISYVLLYYAFVSNVKKKDLPGLLISTFTSGILVSLYGILEHFGHSISCIFAPGLKNFSASCWKQDVQSRVFATFGQPNWLAAYAITILPLSAVLATLKEKSDRSNKSNISTQKMFFSVATALLFAVLIFTRSRSGMVGLIGGLAVFAVGTALIYFKTKEKINSFINLKLATILLTTIIVITGIFGTVFTPSVKELVSKSRQNITQTSEDKNLIKNQEKAPQQAVNRLEIGGTDSGEIRKIVWEGGLKIWQRYPIIGSGVETFAYSYYLDRPREHNDVSEWDFLYNKAHNELINLLATSGILGLLTYLSIFITFGILVIKTIFSDQKENIKLLSLSILSGIVGLFISNFFGFSTVMVNVLMFVFFGVFFILNKTEKDKPAADNTTTKSAKKQKNTASKKSTLEYKIASFDQYFAIIILSIFTLVTLVKTYNYWDADRLFAQGKAHFNAGDFLVGIQKQIKATEKSPNEALYYSNISNDYAKLAIELAKAGQSTASASIVEETIKSSNLAMEKNNRHLNFYKTRSRVFVTLAQLDEKFMLEAQSTLYKAIELAPTDPKLVYTQAIVELSIGNKETGKQLLEKAVELKPDYERAVVKLQELEE